MSQITYDADRQAAAVDWLLEVLQKARLHPEMYFNPIEPAVVESWLHGLRTGLQAFGLLWNSDHRTPALSARALENTCGFESGVLRERGMGPQQIVNELLSIELEMWRVHRASLS